MKATSDEIFAEYERLRAYKESVDLFGRVRRNENFFIGRQWEGVKANGLPTPVILGRRTEAALRAFQRENGLQADGLAGRQSLYALCRK